MARIHFVSVAVVSTVALVVACGGSEVAPIPVDDSGTGSDTSIGNDGGPPGNDAAPVDDSGVVFPDAGNGPPKVVDITFADKCPAFTPCGGAVVGTWDYESACAEGVWDEAKKACPTLGIKSQSGTVQGRIVFTANTVARAVKITFNAKLNLPAGCLQGVVTCQQVQTNLQKAFTTATCVPANGGCDCDVTSVQSGVSNGTTYSLQSNQIVANDNNKFDYCVSPSGESMNYRWVSGPNPERASFVLKKR